MNKTTQHTQHSAPLDLAQFEGHTPGVWEVGSGTDGIAETFAVIARGPLHIQTVAHLGRKELLVFTGSTHGSHATRRNTEEEANARLIAAAPQLLSELQQLRTQRDALAVALRDAITSEGAACFGDMANHPEWMQRRLYAISDAARAVLGATR